RNDEQIDVAVVVDVRRRKREGAARRPLRGTGRLSGRPAVVLGRSRGSALSPIARGSWRGGGPFPRGGHPRGEPPPGTSGAPQRRGAPRPPPLLPPARESGSPLPGDSRGPTGRAVPPRSGTARGWLRGGPGGGGAPRRWGARAGRVGSRGLGILGGADGRAL